MITLQINTTGAWRNVLQFEPARRGEVVKAAAGLASAAGSDVSWSLLHANGKREWLPKPLTKILANPPASVQATGVGQ